MNACLHKEYLYIWATYIVILVSATNWLNNKQITTCTHIWVQRYNLYVLYIHTLLCTCLGFKFYTGTL